MLSEKLNFFVETAKVMMHEKVLVVDSEIDLADFYLHSEMNVDMTYCDPSDFRAITGYPDDYMNSFDVVVCPEAFYKIVCDDRQVILRCLVWAMNSKSRLVFGIPNWRKFGVNKKFDIDGKQHIIRENDRYFILKRSGFFSFLFKRELWHKTTLKCCSQIFKVWNTENPNAQWNFNDATVIERERDFIVSMEMSKKIPQFAINDQ